MNHLHYLRKYGRETQLQKIARRCPIEANTRHSFTKRVYKKLYKRAQNLCDAFASLVTKQQTKIQMPEPYKYISKKSGKAFFLHAKEVGQKTSTPRVFYYFAGAVNEAFVQYKLPECYHIVESNRTGLPMLKKNV